MTGKAGHPSQWLAELAAASGVALESKQFAAVLDSIDPLREYRDRFEIPQEDDKDAIYLCGNSLGAMPKETRKVVNGELNRWGSIGEKGHYTGDIPWATCEELLPELLGDIVGAEDAKVRRKRERRKEKGERRKKKKAELCLPSLPLVTRPTVHPARTPRIILSVRIDMTFRALFSLLIFFI